jgi:flagellar biosynthesis protein FliQ
VVIPACLESDSGLSDNYLIARMTIHAFLKSQTLAFLPEIVFFVTSLIFVGV